MTVKFDGVYTQALLAAGLTEEQAHMYEVLLQRGTRQAGQLPKVLGLSRPYVYKLLHELIAKGLVVKEDPPGKPAQFLPAHPFAIRELVRKREEEVEIAKETVEGVISSLVSDFTETSRLPGVRILPGTEGLSILFADILAEKKDVLLLRSVKDDEAPERQELIAAQLRKEAQLGIRKRAITPKPWDIPDEEIRARDAAYLTERRVIPRERFELPAQVLIYGNKVALTSYEDPVMTTILDNVAIRATFASIFELLWASASELE